MGGGGGDVVRDGWVLLGGHGAAERFKHELLRRYLPQFGGMTGAQSRDRRVVYLDGYAGEGRYENGAPASAAIALEVASFLGRNGRTRECFFAESSPKSYQRLQEVVEGFRARGVRAYTHRGEVEGVLDSVVERAVGETLFPFPRSLWAGAASGASGAGAPAPAQAAAGHGDADELQHDGRVAAGRARAVPEGERERPAALRRGVRRAVVAGALR